MSAALTRPFIVRRDVPYFHRVFISFKCVSVAGSYIFVSILFTYLDFTTDEKVNSESILVGKTLNVRQHFPCGFRACHKQVLSTKTWNFNNQKITAEWPDGTLLGVPLFISQVQKITSS